MMPSCLMLAVAIIPYTEQEFMNEDGIDSELKLEQIQAILGEATQVREEVLHGLFHI